MCDIHYVNILYDVFMLKIKLICVGSIKEPYLKLGIQEYAKRLGRFVQLNIIEVDEAIPKQLNQESVTQALREDAAKIIKAIPSQAYLIILDLKGSIFRSEIFAEKLTSIQQKHGQIVFVIGASNGLDDSIKKLAHESWSFSPLTFPHQLFRLMFLEQLYRAMTIVHHHPYHK